MSGDGITGLDSLRATQAAQGELLARVDERSLAQGREIHDVKVTLTSVDGKVDGIISELATGRGQVAQRRSSATGLKDVITTLIAATGVISAIAVAVLK